MADNGSETAMRMIFRGAALLLMFSFEGAAMGQEAATIPNEAAMRAMGESAIRAQLIDPSSAQFEWPYGFIEGTWPTIWKNRKHDGFITCGFVNAKNRMGGYTGRSSLVVVITGDQIGYVDVGKADGKDWTSRSCARSASEFPATQVTATVPNSSKVTGIADEIAKLAALRNSGTLTEQEFQEQKRKLLGVP